MSFNSPAYVVFLTIIILIYLLVKKEQRLLFLLGVSYLFYSLISLKFVLILFLITVISYVIGQLIENSHGKKKLIYINTGISFILLSLVSLKYLNFLSSGINLITGNNSNSIVFFEMAGISFISFHIISYLLDIYYETSPSEKSFIKFSTYISFFPKLLQGPIERADNFIPQLNNLKKIEINNIEKGSFIILWGLFLKTVVADRISMYINPVYQDPTNASGVATIIAILAYTLQIYFDFAGYTKIAIGSAQLFGITILENFNNPLVAVSCTDFWRRWHISLSSFLRDYLFLPLSHQFRHKEKLGLVLATLITFILAGLWHGPSITFILFGTFHGIWLSLEIIFRKNKIFNKLTINLPIINKIRLYLMRLLTYLGISLSFIFFRSENLNIVFSIFNNLYIGLRQLISSTNTSLNDMISIFISSESKEYPWFTVLINTLILLISFFIIYLARKYSLGSKLQHTKRINSYICAQLLILTIISFGIVSSPSFVYVF
ncbi:MBOAT family O-acyltransferase [Prochlorococcus marinus]|uniref:MBOAT family O-acyltransferase n=1 Tax=Prochlorococcus marinus TaxID=1219 RepID=UPI0022B5453F|nr:MBOAT family O-acyltransferase [Prochlorococcus marinus]